MANALATAAAMKATNVTAQDGPFDVAWGPPHRFPNTRPVALRIEPAALLERLVTALEKLPVFDGAPPRRWPFFPHMTIAEFIDLARSEVLLREMQAKSLKRTWRCEEISYAVPDAAFRFTERVLWKLGTGEPHVL